MECIAPVSHPERELGGDAALVPELREGQQRGQK